MSTATGRPPLPKQFADAERAWAAMETFLDPTEADALKHSGLERELEAQRRELIRKLLQAHLDARELTEIRAMQLAGRGSCRAAATECAAALAAGSTYQARTRLSTTITRSRGDLPSEESYRIRARRA
jgi:hypothetical protein